MNNQCYWEAMKLLINEFEHSLITVKEDDIGKILKDINGVTYVEKIMTFEEYSELDPSTIKHFIINE
jgi:hypothetical protein